MYKYFIKTPWWVRKLFPGYTWRIPDGKKVVYLTFDDGPHPTITPWVLEQLKKYNAAASFFCIGKNVCQYPAVYQQISKEGHTVGNHTYHHVNGWKVSEDIYLKDIAQAAEFINSPFFRPPYGKIKRRQASRLKEMKGDVKIIMWDVLSGDFDKEASPEKCIANVMDNVSPGSIIVFHDSEKAFANLKESLPVILARLSKEGYACDRIKAERL